MAQGTSYSCCKIHCTIFLSLVYIVYSGNRNDINGPRRKQKREGGKEEWEKSAKSSKWKRTINFVC